MYSLLIFGCATKSNIKIQSNPLEAEVGIVTENGLYNPIGKTPLVANDFDIYPANAKYAQIRIKKDGYLDQDVVLAKPVFGADTSVSVQLKKDENIQNVGEQTITQEKVASTIARANGLISSKQVEEAELVMLGFIEQFPSVSVGYDYLGNINYMLKRYPKALKYYNKALSLNPQNAERKVIIERISNLVKGQNGEVQ